ncbi:MAG: hydantoinase B/oxoprolinase family protein, partial [Actinobacteria bacterium]|nr:hydantoinase B/oxoprolinase family protein [Actinomycetota bacterium]
MSSALDIDAITFEIVRHKLVQVTDETIIALENVSGSPITNEGHDMMASLYKADGGLMVGGVGFLHHLTSAAQAVKHIIANFSENPGIGEDDAFFFNDSYTAALHPPDVYMISPIFYEGAPRGFVANFVHVTDIGAIDPGGFSPSARENFHEGFQTKGLKIVEGGVVRKDVLETFLNMVRDPGMTALDLKSQLAANHVAKQRMKELYREYGVDVVDAVSEELIR